MVERLRALGSPALAQFNAWLRRETLPGIFDVLLGSIDIMQARITQANLRAVVKRIKESKLKVQTAIQGDEVRVSAKSRDELQAVIAVLRKADDLDLSLQFLNFQD